MHCYNTPLSGVITVRPVVNPQVGNHWDVGATPTYSTNMYLRRFSTSAILAGTPYNYQSGKEQPNKLSVVAVDDSSVEIT